MPPNAPLQDFWATVCVYLREPVTSEDDGGEVLAGYYRNFGLRATPDRVQPLIEAAIAAAEPPGDVVWAESNWYGLDPESLDDTIRMRILPVTGEGIWYASGRIFFPEEPN